MSEIERALRHPLTWAVGGIASIVGVATALAIDPVSVIAAIIEVFVANSSMVFTASSIAGFTIAPKISAQVAHAFTAIAIVSGAVVVVKIANDFWDKLKEKID